MFSKEKRKRLRRKRRCNAVRDEYIQELKKLTTVPNPGPRILSFDEDRRVREKSKRFD